MTKGIIYYTDNRLSEPILSLCQKYIEAAGLPILSVSLKPLDFGANTVIEAEPGYPAMVQQIVCALEKSTSDFIFFCEHDVLYHKSHFDFTPSKNDTYYYNMNSLRWDYPTDRVIGYDGLTSLSQLCADRNLLLNHFKLRLESMHELGIANFQIKDPRQARIWGYEPGRKKKRNGAFLEESSDNWQSKFPNIDIRHSGTFSLPKVKLKDFHHKPTGWTETTIDKIPGWDVNGLLQQ